MADTVIFDGFCCLMATRAFMLDPWAAPSFGSNFPSRRAIVHHMIANIEYVPLISYF